MTLRLLYICTGNAARSVMAVTMTRERLDGGADVRGAGTMSIPGLPMSQRTRKALADLGFADTGHRSRQLLEPDAEWAELIVGFEPHHVDYVRRTHPQAAAKTATLRRLARDLPSGPLSLAARVAGLGLADVDIEPWEEIVDPAGGDQDDFDRCAREIAEVLAALLPRLAPSRTA